MTRKEKEARGGSPPISGYAQKEQRWRRDVAALPKVVKVEAEPVIKFPRSAIKSTSGKELRGEGEVIEFYPHRSYGFIATDEGNVYFATKQLKDIAPHNGMALSFVASLGAEGWKATEVKAATA